MISLFRARFRQQAPWTLAARAVSASAIVSASMSLIALSGCTPRSKDAANSNAKAVEAPAKPDSKDPTHARHGLLWGWLEGENESPQACLYLATIPQSPSQTPTQVREALFSNDTLQASQPVTAKAIDLASLANRMRADGEQNRIATYGNLAIYSICAAVGGVATASSLGAGAIVIPVCASLFGGYSIVTFLNGEPQVKASRNVLAAGDVTSNAIATWDEVDLIRDKAAAFAEANGTEACANARDVIEKKKARDERAATAP